jgi:hypothetical protein
LGQRRFDGLPAAAGHAVGVAEQPGLGIRRVQPGGFERPSGQRFDRRLRQRAGLAQQQFGQTLPGLTRR